MYRSSRAIIFRFNNKTQWQMFVTLRLSCLCSSEGHKHCVSIQSSITFGDTLLQITREWKTAETWILARLFIYQSSIVSQGLDFFHWMVTIFLVLIAWLVKTENTRNFPAKTQSIHKHSRDIASYMQTMEYLSKRDSEQTRVVLFLRVDKKWPCLPKYIPILCNQYCTVLLIFV